jgi:mannose-6-phosphate isomerase-like protein (cupin superfamily)
MSEGPSLIGDRPESNAKRSGRIRFVHADEVVYTRVRDLLQNRSDGAEMSAKVPQAEQLGQETAYHFPGSDRELQLFEIRCAPDTQFHPHAHYEDEILYVVEGEIRFGRRRYPAGSAVYVPSGTLYSFQSGPDGLRVLNFRPRSDDSYITSSELMKLRNAARASDAELGESAGLRGDQGEL